MADKKESSGVVTLICIACGREQFHERSVPQSTTCDRCGGTVFRTFDTPTEPDEAAIASLEEQARSIAYGDSSPDTMPGEVRDLDAR